MFQNLPVPKLRLLARGIFLATVLALLLSTGSSFSNAGCTDYFSCNKEIERVKKEISRLRGLERNLQNQIAYLDNQIYLTELEIKVKEKEVKLLSADIGDLSQRLNRISSLLKYQEGVFTARARSAYASDQLSPFDVVLGADTLDTAFRKIKYLKVLETQDRETLEEMRETRANFKEQKKTLEGKKADVEKLKVEVEAQKASLIGQKAAKNQLLGETKGEESRYQKKLKFLEAERQAILAALRQRGVSLGDVKKGQPIARQGSTGCSTGPHIHYSVHRSSDLVRLNPCNYVGVVGGSCNTPYLSYGGRVVSGLFFRPASYNNRLTQTSWFAHRALDVVSGDGWVYASADGKAYLVKDLPSYAAICRSNGYPYNSTGYGIRIDHGNGVTTSYWHIKP